LFLLALAPIAEADTITSTNWSGYAAHRSGVRFRNVSATWREPAASCTTNHDTYSSFWVGLGGYSLSSPALEQVGTEVDCNANGRQTLSAWYELVPAPARTIRMAVAPGDIIIGNVHVSGHRVTVGLADATRGEYFAKTFTDHVVDTTSAEWITEAPSDCTSANTCTTLPLANFGTVRFDGARAVTTKGRVASIQSATWITTRLMLGYKAQNGTLVAKAASATATPSLLESLGRSFTVTYGGSSSSTTTAGGGAGGFGGGPGGAFQ
jgi:hypothetical protein